MPVELTLLAHHGHGVGGEGVIVQQRPTGCVPQGQGDVQGEQG